MKKIGATLEFGTERDRELLRAYCRELGPGSTADMQTIVSGIVSSPASRYWVSEERVMRVMTLDRLGRKPLDSMRGPKRRMFADIMQRVSSLRQKRPAAPLIDLVTEVVNSPAPEHYMSVTYARLRIYKAIRDGRRNR